MMAHDFCHHWRDDEWQSSRSLLEVWYLQYCSVRKLLFSHLNWPRRRQENVTQQINKFRRECYVMFFITFHGWAVVLVVKYLELHLSLCLHLCWVCSHVCFWGSQRHRGISQARVSNTGSATYPNAGFQFNISGWMPHKSALIVTVMDRVLKTEVVSCTYTLYCWRIRCITVTKQPLAMKTFALDTRFYESRFIFPVKQTHSFKQNK